MLALAFHASPLQRDAPLRRRAAKALALARALRSAPSLAEGFAQEWELVYELAEAVCDAHVHLRPSAAEVADVLATYPDLMQKLQGPLLVSRL